jgi:hypothetical protein
MELASRGDQAVAASAGARRVLMRHIGLLEHEQEGYA